MTRFPVHAPAAVMALAAFSVAVTSGLIADVATEAALIRALLAMPVGYVAGLVVGRMLSVLIDAEIGVPSFGGRMRDGARPDAARGVARSESSTDDPEDEVLTV